MNFLAHLYLSGNDTNLIIGNFIADMVKGGKINGFSKDIADGIRLHRRIDGFTDAHPVVRQSKIRLRGKYRLYAGVVVDMYYDHFLASAWPDFSHYPLDEFVDNAYRLLQNHLHMMPERAHYVLPHMIENNWLVGYANLNHLKRFFGGMARRTPFESGMEMAVDDLEQDYQLFEKEFRTFFPDLAHFVEQEGVSHDHHGVRLSMPDQ